MGYAQNTPDPCRTCQVMQKHGCQMQGICSKVKAYHRRAACLSAGRAGCGKGLSPAKAV